MHFRQHLPYMLDFGRVVVDEDKALQAEAEFLRDGANAVGLRPPVSVKRDNIVEANHHFRMQFERRNRDVMIVLA